MDTVVEPWRKWTYGQWNDCLVEHYFRPGQPRERLLARLPATPEELADIVRAPSEDADEVVGVFVDRIVTTLGSLSFGRYNNHYGGWTPSSTKAPRSFGMLWFTCLVAYGYPDTVGGFHDRMGRILNKHHAATMRSLPKLWADVAEWSRLNEKRLARTLELPAPCSFRTNIGHSWFLTFPHRDDRLKLRKAFSDAGLIGEEPPIKLAIDALERLGTMSRAFKEDLNHFRREFLESGDDVRGSAFWKTIRQECLEDVEAAEVSHLPVLLAADHDTILPYVGSFDTTVLPKGFIAMELATPVEGCTHFVLAAGEGHVVDRMLEAARALLEGRLKSTTPIQRQADRGIFVFQEADELKEFVPVTGSMAEGSTRALVRDDVVAAFTAAFGGQARDCVPGWQEIIDCRVTIRDDPPPGLPDARHLMNTQVVPGVQLIDGVRTHNGYMLLRGHLPKVRLPGAIEIVVSDAGGHRIGHCRHDEVTDLWLLPRDVEAASPGNFVLRATYTYGAKRKVVTGHLRVVAEHVGTDFRGLPSGRFELETSIAPGFREVNAETPLPLLIANQMPIRLHRVDTNRGGNLNGLATRVRDAIAATAARLKDFHFTDIAKLFAVLFPGAAASKTHLRTLIHTYVASGSLDLVRRQGARSTVIVARRPQFFYHVSEAGVTARLVGLVPQRLEQEVIAVAHRLATSVDLLHAGGSKIPGIVEATFTSEVDLKNMSDMLQLPDPEVAPGFPSGNPLTELLRTTQIPDQYVVKAYFDFDRRRFVWLDSGAVPQEGVQVVWREHPQHHPAYAVVIEGAVLGWSRERNQALLAAYELSTGSVPFALDDDCNVITQVDDLYLPLALARTSTLTGHSPPSLRLTQDDEGFHPRVTYSFSHQHRDLLTAALPLRTTCCTDAT